MAELKRDIVKYVRDRVKKAYDKTGICEICGSTDRVDFHHYSGLTNLLDKWLRVKKIKILTADDIMDVRDEFIEQHYDALVYEAVNLCHKHHELLHSIYGYKPLLSTAKAQERWVERQKEKYELSKQNNSVLSEAQSSPA
jgi:hypothetical protein